MNKRGYSIAKAVSWVLVFVTMLLVAVAIARNGRAAVKDADETFTITNADTEVLMLLTNEASQITYTRIAPQFTLTDAELEEAAEIVAGQAGDKCLTAQIMVANVLYNQILANGGSIDGTEYARYARRTPTEETRAAVEQIFRRGEWMLDDTVLWTDDAANPDAWHQTLQFVDECDGIAFYEERR